LVVMTPAPVVLAKNTNTVAENKDSVTGNIL